MGRNLWIKQLREEDGDLLDAEAADNDPLSGPVKSDDDDKENSPPVKAREPREINIGGKATIFMGKGDRLLIETPGGGAWGAPDSKKKVGEKGIVEGLAEKVKGTVEWAARGSLAERAAAQAGF